MDDTRPSNPNAKRRRKVAESCIKIGVFIEESRAHTVPESTIEKWQSKTTEIFESVRKRLTEVSGELAGNDNIAVHIPIDMNTWSQVRVDTNPQ